MGRRCGVAGPAWGPLLLLCCLAAIAGRAGASQTYVVTVVYDSATYRNVYVLDGETRPAIELVRGRTYTFDQSHDSNVNHPLRFRDSAGAPYTLDVSWIGTPGSSGAQTTFTVPDDAPDDLHYYCQVHNSGVGMGNIITVVYAGTGSDE